jgi:Ca2+-binding RTX toxin-like protein
MSRRRPARRTRSLLSVPMWALAIVSLAVVAGLTATNTVGTSRADDDNRTVSANDRAPTECAGITVVNVIAGINATNGADLVLGTSAAENLDGNQGDDCVLGGAGDDNLRGSQGTDVCVGGPGTDTFHPSCETAIQ